MVRQYPHYDEIEIMSRRTALITGASRGIGKACALTMAAGGHRVALAARSQEKLEEVAEAVRQIGGEPFVVEMDLASRDSIAAGFKKATQEFGRIDILVNNAAMTKDGLAIRMKQADWETVLQTNLSGAFYAIQQVLPGMMREEWGRIVNISSVVGETGNPGQVNYVASKAGLIGVTKALAREMGSRNITVNAVAPGFIETDMTQVLAADLKQKMIDQTPLKRMGSAEDVAHAVRFLASEEASFITGHVLDVNGGMYM
jgi:3-oxoacyl-[acyl-carrier protein] reductase